jgi:sugar (pentulose or hexulose) kinase
LFRRIHRSLHLPQYLAYCLHGKMHNERTSMGCHTLLWDFSGRCFPYWATDSGVAEKFPDLVATDAMETTADSRLVGVGLHDSSAALLPYLIGCPEPFALLSTGTWCVTMVPADAPVLSIAELKRDCLYYLTPTGKPVRASRYPGGLEHDRQIALLAIKHQLAEALFFQAPEALPEAARRDYADWMQTMVAKQVASTRLAIGNARIEALYVDGGFSRNRFFMEGLATAFREIPVFAATVGQASALGAALILHRHWNKGEVPSDIVQLQPYPPNHENGRP